MDMEDEDLVVLRDVAECPAAESHQSDVPRAGQAPTEDMVRGWIDRRESISQRFSESLSYFGDDLGAIVIVEHVLDERPLQGVAGPVAQGLDSVAAVGAAHK